LRRTHHAALRILFAGSAACAAATLGACWDVRVAPPPALDGGPGPGLGLAGGQCSAPELFDDLLIVDEAETRAQLTAALSSGSGLLAVRFVGCEMQVIPGCTVAVKYHFVPVAPKRSHVSFVSQEEIAAGFPSSSAAASALRKGVSLDLDLLVTGTYEANSAVVSVKEMTGTCAGATHVVAQVRVGAFDLVPGGAASGVAVDRCLGALSPKPPLPPECSEPLRVLVAAIPPPPATLCPSGQSPIGVGCALAFPAVDPASRQAAEIHSIVASLAVAKGAARGMLLLQLAVLYPLASPPPKGDADGVIVLRMFLDDPDLATSPDREFALLSDRVALLRLRRKDEALEASRRLVHEFPDRVSTAPAYLDVAGSYCESGDVGTANVLFQDIVKRFGRAKEEEAIAVVAQAKKGCPKGQTAAPGKP
jgi:hypothetical protein